MKIFFVSLSVVVVVGLLWFVVTKVDERASGTSAFLSYSSSSLKEIALASTQLIAANGNRTGLTLANVQNGSVSCSPGGGAAATSTGFFLNVSSTGGNVIELSEVKGNNWKQAIQCVANGPKTSVVSIWEY